MLSQLLLCTGFYALIALPGVGFVALSDRQSRWFGALGVGNAASLAAAILCGYYLFLAGMPFAAFIVLEYLALGCVLVLRRRAATPPSHPVKADGHATLLLPLLLLVFITRSIPLFFSEVPQGLDPCFHTLIAQKILQTSTVPTDWMPFETVQLNYPVGSHILIAETARQTGVPVHIVFKSLFPILACLTTLSIYCVALRLLENRRAAWCSAVAYSFLAVWGSLDYYRWGGLPNLLGMLLLLGLIQVAWAPRERFTALVFGVILAALIISHHHSALCAVVLFAGYVAFTCVLVRRLAGASRTIVFGLVCATLLSVVPLAAYLRGGGEVGQTSVLRFYEPLIPLWAGVMDLGAPLAILGIAGTVGLFRAPKREAILFLTFWIALLFGVFAFFEYVYRFGVYLLDGQFYTALTPSRFLTNLAYPLSIAAGYLMAKLVQNRRWPVAATGFLVASLVWSYFPIRAQCGESEIAADTAAFTWIATHAEPNAFVVSASAWAPYFTGREAAYTALPASEARNSEPVQYKRRVLLRDLSAIADFSLRSRRPVYIALPAQSPPPNPLPEVYRGERTKIYKLAQPAE